MLPIYGDTDEDSESDFQFYNTVRDEIEDEPAIHNALTRFVQRSLSRSSEQSEFDEFDAQERALMLKDMNDSVQERIIALSDAKDRLLCTLLYKICAEVDPSLQHFWSCVTRIHNMNVISRNTYSYLMPRARRAPIRGDSAPLPHTISPPVLTPTPPRFGLGNRRSFSNPFSEELQQASRNSVEAVSSEDLLPMDFDLGDSDSEKQTEGSDDEDDEGRLPSFARPAPSRPPRIQSADSYYSTMRSPDPCTSPQTLSLIQRRPTPRTRVRQFISDVDSSRVFSRYGREFEEIGRVGFGAFGEVYLAKHKLDLRQFAVKKIIFRHKGSANPVQESLTREVRNLARLTNHENVCRYVTSWIEPYKTVTAATTPLRSIVQEDAESPLRTNHIEEDFSNLLNPMGSHERAVPKRPGLQIIASQDVQASFETPPIRPRPRVRRSPSTGFGADMDGEYEQFVHYSCLFVQTEYCGSVTLKDYICDRSRTPNRENFIAVFAQLVMGLAHIHAKNILHRDLKPENIFIHDTFDESGSQPFCADEVDWKRFTLKIGDFGLSKECFGDSIIQIQSLSSTGNQLHTSHVGTQTYASPEQLKGGRYAVSTDIYSLGILLFEVLVPPFDSESERYQALSCLRRLMAGEEDRVGRFRLEQDAWDLISKVERDHPAAMQLIRWCTHPDARCRPSAQALLSDPLFKPFVVNAVLSAHAPAVLRDETPPLSNDLSIMSIYSDVDREEEIDENRPHVECPPTPSEPTKSGGLSPSSPSSPSSSESSSLATDFNKFRSFTGNRQLGFSSSAHLSQKPGFVKVIKSRRSMTPPPRLSSDNMVYMGSRSFS